MGVFSKMFGKYLLITNTVSCGLLMAAGDIMQQRSDFLRNRLKVNDQTTTTTTAPTIIPPMTTTIPTVKDEKSLIKIFDDENENLIRIVSKSEVSNETSDGFDYTRTRNMTAVGLLQGPFHHYFYAALEKYLPGRCTAAIFKKTLLDQTIASPTCLGIFFFGLGFMERKNLQDINGEVKMKLFDTWKVDCMFWPPTQFINFLLVPVRYRVMYINFMTMIYDVFLSYIKYDAEFD